MTIDEKRRHARDLLRRQRSLLDHALRSLPEASQSRAWIDEADRLGDLIDRTLYTMGEMMNQAPARCTEPDHPCPAGGACPDPSLCREVGPCDDVEARKRLLAYVAENQRPGDVLPGGGE